MLLCLFCCLCVVVEVCRSLCVDCSFLVVLHVRVLFLSICLLNSCRFCSRDLFVVCVYLFVVVMLVLLFICCVCCLLCLLFVFLSLCLLIDRLCVV